MEVTGQGHLRNGNLYPQFTKLKKIIVIAFAILGIGFIVVTALSPFIFQTRVSSISRVPFSTPFGSVAAITLGIIAIALVIKYRRIPKDFNGGTTLHRAVRDLDGRRIEHLAKKKGLLEKQDNFNYTPLQLAVMGDHKEVAKKLISAGASKAVLAVKGQSLLHLVMQYSTYLDEDYFNYWISEKMDVNSKDNDGETPLFYAVRNNNVEAVKLLCKQEALLDEKNHLGETALHIAAKFNFILITGILLEARANPNIQNNETLSPLHVAVKENNENVVVALVHCTANRSDLLLIDKSGNTPLHLAVNMETLNKDIIQNLTLKMNSLKIKNCEGLMPFDILEMSRDEKKNEIIKTWPSK